MDGEQDGAQVQGEEQQGGQKTSSKSRKRPSK